VSPALARHHGIVSLGPASQVTCERSARTFSVRTFTAVKTIDASVQRIACDKPLEESTHHRIGP